MQIWHGELRPVTRVTGLFFGPSSANFAHLQPSVRAQVQDAGDRA